MIRRPSRDDLEFLRRLLRDHVSAGERRLVLDDWLTREIQHAIRPAFWFAPVPSDPGLWLVGPVGGRAEAFRPPRGMYGFGAAHVALCVRRGQPPAVWKANSPHAVRNALRRAAAELLSKRPDCSGLTAAIRAIAVCEADGTLTYKADDIEQPPKIITEYDDLEGEAS